MCTYWLHLYELFFVIYTAYWQKKLEVNYLIWCLLKYESCFPTKYITELFSNIKIKHHKRNYFNISEIHKRGDLLHFHIHYLSFIIIYLGSILKLHSETVILNIHSSKWMRDEIFTMFAMFMLLSSLIIPQFELLDSIIVI